MFEINLTRLFSVAQFYHFAFMIVSLAMLGFGASGTWLALRPRWGQRRPRLTITALALAFGLSAEGAYLLINRVPFDSFSIAWDSRQVVLLFLHYVALSLPFFFSGAVLSLLFRTYPGSLGSIYAYNLVGSAVGCVLALVVPGVVGGVGVVWLSGGLGGVAALVMAWRGRSPRPRASRFAPVLIGLLAVGLVLASAILIFRSPGAVALNLSPYKGLSYALQIPGARVIYRAWNGFSRVDLVDSPAIRSLPGLSYRYLAPPPSQHGLFVDGDDMSPVLQLEPEALDRPADEDLAFAAYLPTAVAYRLRPEGRVGVLAPRGGLELWVALSQGGGRAVAAVPNPLVVDAVGELYENDRVVTVPEEPRSFVRRPAGRDAAGYDVLTLALTAPYRPVRSGAYSLAEDYAYTVEAFRDYLARLSPDGILVVSRWVQTPPSESLRAFALAVTAVEQAGGDPARQIVAFRGYAVMTLLVKRRAFTTAELAAIRNFAGERAFDLVHAPDLRPEEVNRYNVLASPDYYTAFRGLLRAQDRDAWYAGYPLDVRPPTDNHPFFGHFFRWSQVGQVMAELGKSWQPFGGAGYFVVLALLSLSVVAATLLIGLPALALRRRGAHDAGDDAPAAVKDASRGLAPDLLYFGLLGLGYLLVEIPLMQRAILFLGHPAYAVTTVLFALLLFSGLGSALSDRWSPRRAVRAVLVALVALVFVYAFGLPRLFDALLGLPWLARLLVTVLVLAPCGFLMGIPFPLGLRRFGARAPRQVPWAWAANGAMSVVASVLSALLALSLGFRVVLMIGALCYGSAWVVVVREARVGRP
jgi:hypothetical protein